VDFVQGFGVARPQPLSNYLTQSNTYHTGDDTAEQADDDIATGCLPATCR